MSRIKATIKALTIKAIYFLAKRCGLFVMPIDRVKHLHDYVQAWDKRVTRQLGVTSREIGGVMVAILHAIDEYETATKGKVWPDDATNLLLHSADTTTRH